MLRVSTNKDTRVTLAIVIVARGITGDFNKSMMVAQVSESLKARAVRSAATLPAPFGDGNGILEATSKIPPKKEGRLLDITIFHPKYVIRPKPTTAEAIFKYGAPEILFI